MADFDFDRLDRIAAEKRAGFAAAEPFPHVVIDDFLPVEVAEDVLAEFGPEGDAWNHYHHYNEKKLGQNDIRRFGPHTRAAFEQLQSDRFVGFLESLTGIDNLVSDPELDGAGLHQIMPGGYLNIHTDFLAHTKNRHWSRELNLLIYFNKDWRDDWNGNLELWDADMTHCVHSIAPIFNRCVIFHTREKSFHGHPNKLSCPPGRSRKSIALYYFQPQEEVRRLTPTNYRARPEDTAWKSAMIAADRALLRAYSFVKRYTGLTDDKVNRILKRF